MPNIGWERRCIHISDREEREERMDDLERQMEHLRSQMQRTLGGAEGSGRLTALERLRSSLSGLPRRAAARDPGESDKDPPNSAEGLDPTRAREAGGGPQAAAETSEQGGGGDGRGWFKRFFGFGG